MYSSRVKWTTSVSLQKTGNRLAQPKQGESTLLHRENSVQILICTVDTTKHVDDRTEDFKTQHGSIIFYRVKS